MASNQEKKANNTGEQAKIYWDQSCFVDGGELIKSVFVTTGTIRYAKVVNVKGKECVSIQFVSVIGDKLVTDAFGAEYVNGKHEVCFNFLLSGFDAEHFMTDRRPRWGQTIDVTLVHLTPNSYTDNQGEVRRDISAWLAPKGFRVFGSRFGSDGQERKPVQLNGYDDREENGATSSAAAKGVKTRENGRNEGGYKPRFYSETDDDEDLPF